MAGQEFSLAIAAWCEKSADRADRVLRKVALDIGARVVLRSPVDTGRFRANWQYGVGGPNTATLVAADKSGQSSIARIAAGVATARLGDVIYISNALPYALRLETGWSKQAPAGMVGLTVAEFQSAIDRAVAAAQAERR
ncbi:HK97 gp10 family phage protein [Methylobacterium fujisawaense]|uniref:HK97 gp10 family phage protein n=1 Tax=Methylobacterium fujisawaense TaxID=107400 RepID=UPI00244B26A5|nr:HK97 gp10 family phage protein [Methylobacterium fujisawaense]MDH3027638.1 HK97 gp10 family phage protein [Methylobacterium fujisawaense]